jgi:hypothetical protein
LGDYPDVPLALASERRDTARKLLAAGVDPSENRKAAKATRLERVKNSFEVVMREWLVEHFRENIAPLLNGKAKAMVVVASRLEAVRWKLTIEKYIKDQGYRIGALVAFSGEVNDTQSGPDPFTEAGRTLNPNLRGRDT